MKEKLRNTQAYQTFREVMESNNLTFILESDLRILRQTMIREAYGTPDFHNAGSALAFFHPKQVLVANILKEDGFIIKDYEQELHTFLTENGLNKGVGSISNLDWYDEKVKEFNKIWKSEVNENTTYMGENYDN